MYITNGIHNSYIYLEKHLANFNVNTKNYKTNFELVSN